MNELHSLGHPVIVNQTGRELEGQSLIQFLQDAKATIAVIGKESVTAPVLEGLTHLRAIAKYGVGTDSIDLEALKKHGIAFGHTAGVNRLEVAEHVLGFAIGHFRQLFNANAAMHKGVWQKNGGRDLSSLKVGIIGFGYVGSAVAERLSPFDCKIFYTDIIGKSADASARKATYISFDDLVSTCDLITLHVPLTDKTRGMISKDVIANIKHDALLINTARGEIVDFDAAIAAVEQGRLGGFATDVYKVEPIDLGYLGGKPNLYFTPHIAANSKGAVLKMGRAAIAWVRTFTTPGLSL